MINSAMQYGDQLVLLDKSGQRCGTISLNGGEFLGHSSHFIVVRYGDQVFTLDENQTRLGSASLNEDFRITGITDNGFYTKCGSAVDVFDAHCNHIDRYTV